VGVRRLRRIALVVLAVVAATAGFEAWRTLSPTAGLAVGPRVCRITHAFIVPDVHDHVIIHMITNIKSAMKVRHPSETGRR